MIVPDASAATLLFTDPTADSRAASARTVLAADPAWIVPEHWHTEVFSAIRGLWLGKRLDDAHAERAAATLARMVVGATPTAPLLPRMWELRSSLSAYDAAYVAAAESHACTLVTADARIARSGAARCDIRVID
ncbi:type II toxin-antitoxin system VapC family toxin [Ruania rhizosphaerae]|uniref:type II toxin-antitoxin system VapC family toxin n=1 Tax=Ruania rhizosphaerae TaxID=1840413 RepID=UPI0013591B04|nr:PIN domain-containing protein [Ruania rhizosphaerae]